MLADAIAATVLILATWGVYGLVILGFSAWYMLRFHKGCATIGDYFTGFWVGLATLLGALQFWHFFAPVNAVSYGVLMGIGACGLLLLAPELWRSLRNAPGHSLRTGILLFMPIAIWLANRATGPGAEYDSGLYHIAAINWTRLYRIVPGLANLHMRFGFSSTMTLLSAWLDHGPWAGNANHIVNGFFLAALAAAIVRSFIAILSSAAPFAPHHWLLIFSSVLLVDWGIDIQAASYSTDIGAVVLTVAAAHYFLQAFAAADRAAWAFVAVLLCAAAVTAKASTLVLCAPMAATLLVLLWCNAPPPPARRIRACLPAIVGAMLLIVPWLIRQVILSGYPLFPSEFLGFPVDWKMPFAKVQWLRRIMLNFDLWNRYEDPRGLEWLPVWVQSRIVAPVVIWKALIPAAVALAAICTAVIRWSWLRKARTAIRGPVLLFSCTLLAALAWFKSAPDPRYASQIFVLMMAVALLLAKSTFPTAGKTARNILLIAAALFAIGPLFVGTQEAQRYTGRTIAGVWILPPTSGLFYPTPQGEVKPITTAAGLQIYVPVPPSGKTFEDRTWDAPLPNAPFSEIDPIEVQIPPLRLRTPADLQEGFKRTP